MKSTNATENLFIYPHITVRNSLERVRPTLTFHDRESFIPAGELQLLSAAVRFQPALFSISAPSTSTTTSTSTSKVSSHTSISDTPRPHPHTLLSAPHDREMGESRDGGHKDTELAPSDDEGKKDVEAGDQAEQVKPDVKPFSSPTTGRIRTQILCRLKHAGHHRKPPHRLIPVQVRITLRGTHRYYVQISAEPLIPVDISDNTKQLDRDQRCQR